MTPAGSLLACIEQHGPDDFVGVYVGEDAGPDSRRNYIGRAPATQRFASHEAALRWVHAEATALSLPIKWVDQIPWLFAQTRTVRPARAEVS